MKKIDLVCLCDLYDMKGQFGEAFAADHPGISLLLPQEVKDPGAIRHAIAFCPGPKAFAPYPNLALVSSVGAGVDALLHHPGLGPQVKIARLIDAEQAQMMAGFALWFIIGWQRRMWAYGPLQAAGKWQPINRTPPSAFPVGILGFGNMGRSLAVSLRSLGFPVTAYASSAGTKDGFTVLSGPTGLTEIAGNSRAVVNLLPLTPETEGLLSADFFAAMRDDAILVQLGRGGHLLEEDLIPALDKGRPALAALDVFASEPLPADHPFWQHEKIMMTPHVASDADPRSVAARIAEGIERFEAGENPAGLVDRNRGY
jgi:glyoxylate/hydroxypyruvate reductase A